MADKKVDGRSIWINVNSDGAEKRHLGNITRANELAASHHNELYVLNPVAPKIEGAHHYPPTSASLRKLVKELTGTVTKNDTLTIYLTGHGKDEQGGCLVLKDTCLSKNDKIFKDLFSLPHKKRTVLMSQCLSGNWAGLFKTADTSLFDSVGSKGEVVCCQDFDPIFFGLDSTIPDKNGDGTKSWLERYQYAESRPQSAVTFFLPGKNYVDTGAGVGSPQPPTFKAGAYDVTTVEEFNKLLGAVKANPGTIAVVYASAQSWCEPCQKFTPVFKQLAKERGGQELYIHIPDADDKIWKDVLEIKHFPTVFLIDHRGLKIAARDYKKPLDDRFLLTGAQWADKDYCLEMAQKDISAGKHIPIEFFEDPIFAKKILTISGLFLQYLTPTQQDDWKLVKVAIDSNAAALEFASARIKKNSEKAHYSISKHGSAYKFIDAKFKSKDFPDQREWLVTATMTYAIAVKDADPMYKTDGSLVAFAVTVHGDALAVFDPIYLEDRELVLEAVKTSDKAFKLAKKYQDDIEVAKAAIDKDKKRLYEASYQLTNNARLAQHEVRNVGRAYFNNISERLRKDLGLAVFAVRVNINALTFMDADLIGRPEVTFSVLETASNLPDKTILNGATPDVMKSYIDMFVSSAISDFNRAFKWVPQENYSDPKFGARVREYFDKIEAYAEEDQKTKTNYRKLELLVTSLAGAKIPKKYMVDESALLELLARNPNAWQQIDNTWKTRAFTLKALEKNAALIKHLDITWRSNPKYIELGVSADASMLASATPELLNDPNFVKRMIMLNGKALAHSPEKFQNSPDFILGLLSEYNTVLTKAIKTSLPGSDERDKITRPLLSSLSHVAKNLKPKFKADTNFVAKVLRLQEVGLSIFRESDSRIRGNRALLLQAAELGIPYREIPDEYKKDEGVLLSSIKRYGNQFMSTIDYEFRKANPDFCLRALAVNPSAILAIPSVFATDPAFLEKAVKQHTFVLMLLSAHFKKNPSIVRSAAISNAAALKFADELLKKDPGFILDLIAENAKTLKYADINFRRDPQFAHSALTVSGEVMNYFEPELREDRQFTLEAVSINGAALQGVHKKYRKDPTVSLLAIKQMPLAMGFVDPSLKQSRKFVLKAVKAGGLVVLAYVDKKFSKDPKVLKLLTPIERGILKFVRR